MQRTQESIRNGPSSLRTGYSVRQAMQYVDRIRRTPTGCVHTSCTRLRGVHNQDGRRLPIFETCHQGRDEASVQCHGGRPMNKSSAMCAAFGDAGPAVAYLSLCSFSSSLVLVEQNRCLVSKSAVSGRKMQPTREGFRPMSSHSWVVDGGWCREFRRQHPAEGSLDPSHMKT